MRVVLRRGIETGELRADIDVEVAMLMLTGAVMARGKHDPTPAAPRVPIGSAGAQGWDSRCLRCGNSWN